jgi:hypothetical protein
MNQAGPENAGSRGARKFLLTCAHVLTGLGLLGLFVVHPDAPRAAAPRVPPGSPVAKPVVAATKLAVAPEVVNAPLIPPAPPNVRGAVPVGKGMWIWQAQSAEGGNAQAIVARAQRHGMTHLYVYMGSSIKGFIGGPFLDAVLPVAHAAGIRIYGWDFPYLDNIEADVARAAQAARYVTPTGHRIDGFAADIEFRSMGVNLSPATTDWYGHLLRHTVGPGFPLIAVVPRPTHATTYYPYETVVKMFDAIAPMIYWMGNDPAVAVQMAYARLAPFGKPILPVGQAYDGFPEGGPPGVPNRGSIHRFMGAVADHGGTGVSFWSWQHATQEVWQAVSDAAVFQLPVGDLSVFRADQVRAYQVLLTSLGFGVPPTGVWGAESDAAVRAFQKAARLPVTGGIDPQTRAYLLHPVPPPLR